MADNVMQKVLPILMLALWVVAIAIISVQNATPVSVQFLGFRSVEIPFGVILSLFAAGGMVATAAALGLLNTQPLRRR